MGASGTATLDFGVFPGGYDTSVAVTGQTGIAAGSLVEAWIRPVGTADHTADEHMLEPIKVIAGNIVAGTGFTIYGFNTHPVPAPVDRVPDAWQQRHTSATAVQWTQMSPRQDLPPGPIVTEPVIPKIYGLFTVAWVWN